MKNLIVSSIIGSTVLFVPFVAQALTVEEVANPRLNNGGWVTDMADILSDRTEAELNQLITNLEKNNSTEIAVVTVPETAPANSPKAFATQLFNHWGIGKAELDNGILFLISHGDRRVEIETGYGMAEILPDAEVKDIIDTQITPQYKQGNFDRGTLEGTKALIATINPDTLEQIESNNNNTRSLLDALSNKDFWATLVFIGGLPATILYLKRMRKNKNLILFLSPQGESQRLNIKKYEVRCKQCEGVMKQLDTNTLNSILKRQQKVAQNLGSATYTGWQCQDCSQIKGNDFVLDASQYHLICDRSKGLYSTRFEQCPHCQEPTIIRTKNLKKVASLSCTGMYQVVDSCQCCSYQHKTEEIIPKRKRTTTYSQSRSYKKRRNSSSSSSSYGGYGGCSGGSSGGGFGGGSSGGGGAGGGW